MASLTLPLLLLLLLVGSFTSPSSGQALPLTSHCPDSTLQYTSNSTFWFNLLLLLRSLPANASASGGFAASSTGSVPDRVFSLALCRGDASQANCRDCLVTAASDILDRCSYKRTAEIWYDNCLLRYSDMRIASQVGIGWRYYMKNRVELTTEIDRFNTSVWDMIGPLTEFAANNVSARPPMFATGRMPFSDELPWIYGLVQCTRDLSPGSCNQCLQDITREATTRFYKKRGARVLTASCNFRYEVYTFYSGSAMLTFPMVVAAVPSLAPSKPPAPVPAFSTPPLLTEINDRSKQQKRKNGVRVGLMIVVPSVVGGVLVLMFLCCFWLRKKAGAKTKYDIHGEEVPSVKSLLFDLPTIRNATHNFSESNKLGEGGFGSVFKGMLPNGQEIAVKRLSVTSHQGVEELKNEVLLLAKLKHKNLVSLLGVCLEGQEKLLIYEYVANKSLDTFLFDQTKKEQLLWERRRAIIAGIARGLLYLHEESQVKVIHRDLKAGNVLLDDHVNPKISDFGLARLFSVDQTHAKTRRVVGTLGYMPPEYVWGGNFSSKTDVFSFGVLMLEVITGRKNSDVSDPENPRGLLSYVWEHWCNGTAMEVVDPCIRSQCPEAEALRCIQVAITCVQDDEIHRPTMATVVLMLSSHSVVVEVPGQPAFLAGSIHARSYTSTVNLSI